MHDDTFYYTVSLTHVPSGQNVEITQSAPQQYRDSQVFLWEEGNYSCNCNRFLFFHRALGKSEEEIEALDPSVDPDFPDIGHCDAFDKAGFIYRVDWIRDDQTGEILYSEPKETLKPGDTFTVLGLNA